MNKIDLTNWTKKDATTWMNRKIEIAMNNGNLVNVAMYRAMKVSYKRGFRIF